MNFISPPNCPVLCRNLDDYVLKVAGEESYIYGHYELITFSYIIRCIGKKIDIVLALVRKKDTEEDGCRDVPDVSGSFNCLPMCTVSFS